MIILHCLKPLSLWEFVPGAIGNGITRPRACGQKTDRLDSWHLIHSLPWAGWNIEFRAQQLVENRIERFFLPSFVKETLFFFSALTLVTVALNKWTLVVGVATVELEGLTSNIVAVFIMDFLVKILRSLSPHFYLFLTSFPSTAILWHVCVGFISAAPHVFVSFVFYWENCMRWNLPIVST